MSSPARKLNTPSEQMDLKKLESELLSLPFIVRRHLAHTLLDSVDEGEAEHAAHLHAMEAEEVDVETAWAEEAHRRWEAYQRGEEEMLDFDDVMAGIRASLRR